MYHYSDSDDLSVTNKPILYELDRIEYRGKIVRVIDRVAAKWEKVATRLHFEGHEIKRIERDNHYQSTDSCRAMLIEWLGGNGREPKTWETIIKALIEADLSTCAEDLNWIMTQDHSQNKSSTM